MSDLRHALRVGVAAIFSLAIVHALHLTQGYWTILTAVLVVQSSVGGSMKFAIDRMIGTVGGAVYGAVIAAFMPHDHGMAQYITLLIGVMPPAVLASINPSFRIAPVTVVIVLFSTAAQEINVFMYAVERVLEIGLGSILGLAVSLVILPARAHGIIMAQAASILGLYAGLLNDLSGGAERSLIGAQMDKIRAAITKIETVADEAKRERKTYVTGEPDPDPLLRNLRRLRHDLVMFSRAVTQALPSPAAERLQPYIRNVSDAAQQSMRDAIGALSTRSAMKPITAFDEALAAYNGEVSAIRADHILRELPVNTVSRLFTLGFVLDQLHQNLSDLVDRIGEFEQKAKGITV
ncbi:MAG: hypothetical protein JWO78_2161 [Micavibrio sp.]|nr:hypothetical protein [Micavibrio sp.]